MFVRQSRNLHAIFVVRGNVYRTCRELRHSLHLLGLASIPSSSLTSNRNVCEPGLLGTSEQEYTFFFGFLPISTPRGLNWPVKARTTVRKAIVRSETLFCVPSMVNLTAIALAGTLFFVTDFQGRVLDDAGSISSDRNPVIGFPINWSLVGTNTNNQFNIQNGATNTFLSYAGAPSGIVSCAQAAINSAPRTFSIVLAAPPQQYNILDVSSGLALTAWKEATDRVSTVTPVTYDALEPGAVDQMWTLVNA
ncbi:hypothetical protein B0H13DRAFT_1879067 [Mycena leptocephala]|nr:hypothetical protein B0H13DRAFT_1879067 [Mycena leptocephala]